MSCLRLRTLTCLGETSRNGYFISFFFFFLGWGVVERAKLVIVTEKLSQMLQIKKRSKSVSVMPFTIPYFEGETHTHIQNLLVPRGNVKTHFRA